MLTAKILYLINGILCFLYAIIALINHNWTKNHARRTKRTGRKARDESNSIWGNIRSRWRDMGAGD